MNDAEEASHDRPPRGGPTPPRRLAGPSRGMAGACDRDSLSHAVRCSTRIWIQAQAAAPAVEGHRRPWRSMLCQVWGMDSTGQRVASGPTTTHVTLTSVSVTLSATSSLVPNVDTKRSKDRLRFVVRCGNAGERRRADPVFR